MNAAVVYFTYNGNCAVAAKALSSKLDCNVVELEEAKKRKTGFFGFVVAGIHAATRKKTKLKFDVNERFGIYQHLYIITPIWASRCTPAVSSLINDLDFSNKTVTLITVQSDKEKRGSDKAITSMRKLISDKGGLVKSSIRLVGGIPSDVPPRDDIIAQLDQLSHNL